MTRDNIRGLRPERQLMMNDIFYALAESVLKKQKFVRREALKPASGHRIIHEKIHGTILYVIVSDTSRRNNLVFHSIKI